MVFNTAYAIWVTLLKSFFKAQSSKLGRFFLLKRGKREVSSFEL